MLVAQELENGSSQCWYVLACQIYSGSRFSEGVMGVRMSIPKTYVALAPTLATLPPRADALKGMAKPLE